MNEDFNQIETVKKGLKIAPFVVTAALSYFYFNLPNLSESQKVGLTEVALIATSFATSRAERDLLGKTMAQKDFRDFDPDEQNYLRYEQYMTLKIC
jgi:hypothetical protein